MATGIPLAGALMSGPKSAPVEKSSELQIIKQCTDTELRVQAFALSMQALEDMLEIETGVAQLVVDPARRLGLFEALSVLYMSLAGLRGFKVVVHGLANMTDAPFSTNPAYKDLMFFPTPGDAWGLFIQNSPNLLLYGGGFCKRLLALVSYVGDTCVAPANCQNVIFNIDSASTGTKILGLSTVGVTNMLNVNSVAVIPQSANCFGMQATILRYTSRLSPAAMSFMCNDIDIEFWYHGL
ncbi:hypothetical protein BKA62DRAFT_828016 [Auriculariales sp. MPI-PUGE-AT-0066]|nr:hypothetical protein BKA62DRAFT_828016 [Auriculariales sp. MPI-PUGE-AT-0066]